MTVLQRRLLTFLLPLVSFGVTGLAMELGLRLLGRPAWDPPTVAGWRFARSNEVNQLGFRGRPISYDKTNLVVVLLGDSFVESVASPFARLPEQLLESHLRATDPRYKVFSLGTGGYGTDQELCVLREYFERYRADWVIIWQTFSNDVWNNVFPTHWPKDGMLKPTFWLEADQLRGPNYQMGQVVLGPARTKIGVLLNRWRNPRHGMDQRWEAHLPPAYAPLLQSEGPFQTDWDPAGPLGKINPLLPDENPRTEKSHLAVWLTPRSARMQYGLDLSRRLYDAVQGLCEAHGSRFSIFYPEPPDQVGSQAADVVVQKIGDRFYRTSLAQFRANHSYLNDGLEVFAIPVQVADWRVSESDGHLNDAANDQVLRSLAVEMGTRPPAQSKMISEAKEKQP